MVEVEACWVWKEGGNNIDGNSSIRQLLGCPLSYNCKWHPKWPLPPPPSSPFTTSPHNLPQPQPSSLIIIHPRIKFPLTAWQSLNPSCTMLMVNILTGMNDLHTLSMMNTLVNTELWRIIQRMLFSLTHSTWLWWIPASQPPWVSEWVQLFQQPGSTLHTLDLISS